MPRFLIIFAIAACYFVFAILLNSVGTVILQSINSFDIGKADASLLEGYKDLPIAIVSFLVASIIPRIGYRFALLLALWETDKLSHQLAHWDASLGHKRYGPHGGDDDGGVDDSVRNDDDDGVVMVVMKMVLLMMVT